MTRPVSIVIPVYNDADGLQRTLDSLDATAAAEIVVVDNGSTDQTAAVAHEHPDDRVRVVSEPAGGSYRARNRGIEAASREWLCFIDADVYVGPDFVTQLLGRAHAADAPYVGANVVVPGHPERFPVQQYLDGQAFAPTCGLLVNRAVIKQVGRFDARLASCGDLEFGQRVDRAGITQAYAPCATIEHPVRSRLGELRKLFRVGRGHAALQRRHPDRYGPPGRPPTPDGGGDGGVAPVKLAAKGAGWLVGTVAP
jgi:glycosyltransferase involved in cell wall biosynthesis